MYILGGEEKYEYLDSHTYYCSYRCDHSWCSVFCTGFGPVIKIHLDFTSCFDKKQLIFLGGVTLWEKKENA